MGSLSVRGVTKTFGALTVLKDIELEAEDGEFIVLVGPSGCGKSTLLAMISGLETVTAGEIRIAGRAVNRVAPKDRNIAMVFQSYALYPTMTVRQNITFGMECRSIPKAEQDAAVERVASLLQIGQLLGRKPSQLSGGQRQRVALARSLVRTPRVFLMDEPLSNLDAKLRVTMRAELKHLHHELRVTTIYVTHDQMEAMTLASRIAVMNKGIIMQLAVPEVIYNDPANLFVAGFIGSPSMNLLDGALVDGTFRSGSLVVPALGGGTRDRVVLGVRPEDVSVVSTGTGLMDVPVYAFELTGESVLVTVTVGDRHLSARGDRHFRCQIGDRVGISFPPERAYLFDAESQDRIRL